MDRIKLKKSFLFGNRSMAYLNEGKMIVNQTGVNYKKKRYGSELITKTINL